METLNIQVAFFFKEDYTKLFENLSINIQEIFGEPYKQYYIPIEKSAKSDLPRHEISYNGCKIISAKNRIDIFLFEDDAFNDYINKFNDIDFDKLGIIIKRIGLVKRCFRKLETSKLKSLLNEKLREQDYKEINLKINIENKIENKTCNNIETIEYGEKLESLSNNKKVTKGYYINRDINTIPEESYDFSKDDRIKIINTFHDLSQKFLLKENIK